MKKICIFIVIFGLFLNLNAAANIISFYVIESGVPEDRNEILHSVLWENAFLDIFFDAGYIVSNSPILRLDTKPSDILDAICIDEAISAGIDIMVIARLDYAPDAHTPEEIALFIYRITPLEKILERQVPGRARDLNDIRAIVRGLIPHLE